MNTTSVFAEITKTAPQDDGSLMVYGKATGSDLDLDGQRCSPIWLQQAMPEFMKIGNVREQHDAHRAVGKAVEHDVKDDGHYIRAHIVDPVAVAKTRAGVFTGFSIGIKSPILEKGGDAPNGIISGGSICEISLVDRPALPTATLTVCKAAKPGMQIKASDFDSSRMLVRVEELIEKTIAPDVVKTEMTVTLADQLDPEQLKKLTAMVVEAGEVEHSPSEVFVAMGKELAKTFDRGKAIDLVKTTLEKAAADMPPAYAPEQDDIQNAQAAIGIISRLIISEASEMCDNPAEDCDIELLMQAVQSLRCFQHREQQQAMGADVVNKPVLMLAADVELAKANNSDSHTGSDESVEPEKEKAVKVDQLPEDVTSEVDVEKSADEAVEDGAGETEEVIVDKTVDPEATKAAVEPDGDALVKALSAALEKADNPLRKSFEAIIEASTETVVKSVTELTERLVKVESMAVPGGPAVRRTEVEHSNARKNDLMVEAARFKSLAAANSDDPNLRKGYDALASQLDAQIKAL